MSLVNYIKKVWNSKSTFNPSVMNNIEDGIYNNAEAINGLDDRVVVIENKKVDIATPTTVGTVKPDNDTITVDADGTLHGANTYELPIATETVLGGVKPDGTTITIEEDGTIHGFDGSNVPTLVDVYGSSEYNSSTSYTVGNHLIHNNKLYRVKVACVGIEPPNATYYEEVNLSSLNTNLANLSDVVSTTITTSYGQIIIIKIGKIVRVCSNGALKNLGSVTSLTLAQLPYVNNGYTSIVPCYTTTTPYAQTSASAWVNGTALNLYKASNVTELYINGFYITV